jgi:trans-aconitate methyltransferase
MIQKHICYLCFSENTGYIGRNIDFDTDIYVCNNCGLIQNDFVNSLYLDSYYHKNYREERKEAITDKYLEFMSLRAGSQHKFISENLPNGTLIGSVLDIGAGAGKLLEKFKDQATLHAVESDLAMREYMQKIGLITVINDSQLFGGNNKFDLITMSHVFEHINNPLEYLYRLHQIVADNSFVFMEIPNEPVHLVSHNVLKKKKGIGHLFDYTIDTFRQMIAKSNLFDVISLATYSVSVDDYLKGASIRNFEENKRGDGIHIRALLRRKNFIESKQEHIYIDAVLQNQYRKQLISEKQSEALLLGLDKIRLSLLAAKSLLK